jgi:predicted transcriptional regulator
VAEQSNADLFGTFLESVRRQEVAQQRQSGHLDGDRLLAALHGSGPQPVSDLFVASGLSFSDFTVAIQAMEANGLVTMQGEPGKERVALTERGEYIAGAPR